MGSYDCIWKYLLSSAPVISAAMDNVMHIQFYLYDFPPPIGFIIFTVCHFLHRSLYTIM